MYGGDGPEGGSNFSWGSRGGESSTVDGSHTGGTGTPGGPRERRDSTYLPSPTIAPTVSDPPGEGWLHNVEHHQHQYSSCRPITARPTRSGFVDSGSGIDDVDETGWMFTLLPPPPEAPLKQRMKAELRKKLKGSYKYLRHFVRVSVRSGVPMLYIHESENPEDPPLFVFDLTHIVTVEKYSIPAEAPLKLKRYDEDHNSYDETVYGQIGLLLKTQAPACGVEPESIQEVKLGFEYTEDRDAWATWFGEIVVLREVAQIELAGGGTPSLAFLQGAAGVPEEELISPRSLTSTTKGKSALRDYTRFFLQGGSGLREEGGAPNKGKIRVRAPDAETFQASVLSGNVSTGEISLSKKKSTSGGGGSPQRKGGDTQRFILAESCKIVAPQPWNSEFHIAFGEAKIWHFQAEGVEQRNAFVAWLRSVKGRGKLAQSERDTFPYLNAKGAQDNDEGEEEEGIRQLLKDKRSRSFSMFGEGESSLSPPGRKRGDIGGSEEELLSPRSPKGGARKRAKQQQLTRRTLKTPGVFGEIEIEEESIIGSSDEEEEEELLDDEDDEMDRSSVSLSSLCSMHSVRPFHPWPTFQAEVLFQYIDETTYPFVVGLGRGTSTSRSAARAWTTTAGGMIGGETSVPSGGGGAAVLRGSMAGGVFSSSQVPMYRRVARGDATTIGVVKYSSPSRGERLHSSAPPLMANGTAALGGGPQKFCKPTVTVSRSRTPPSTTNRIRTQSPSSTHKTPGRTGIGSVGGKQHRNTVGSTGCRTGGGGPLATVDARVENSSSGAGGGLIGGGGKKRMAQYLKSTTNVALPRHQFSQRSSVHLLTGAGQQGSGATPTMH